MSPAAGQSALQRATASKIRTDNLMEKLRFNRVVDKLREDKTIFSDVERYMLAEQYINPLR